MTNHDAFRQLLEHFAAFCAARNLPAWLVGGSVRDLLRATTPADLDIAVTSDGVVLARAFADASGGSFVALDDERGTGRAVYGEMPDQLVLDIARLRGAAGDIAADLRLRDFTINALAVELTIPTAGGAYVPAAIPAPAQVAPERLVDPCGGYADLQARRLRTCSPRSLADDPLRALRAVRLAAALDLELASELMGQMRIVAPAISAVAAERVRDELLKLLATPRATGGLHLLDEARLLTRIIPELEPARNCDQPRVHFLPVLAHLLETVAAFEWLTGSATPPAAVAAHPELPRKLPYAAAYQAHLALPLNGGHGYSRNTLLKLAALLHDNAKPQTKVDRPDGSVTFYGHQEQGAAVAAEIARRLRLSRQTANYLHTIVAAHMRPGQLRAAPEVGRRAVARFFRDLGAAGPDVLLIGLADHLAARGPQIDPPDWQAHLLWVGAMLDAYWGEQNENGAVQPLVDGHVLMAELGLEPGKIVGQLLREIGEAQAAGEIGNRAQALTLARRLLAENN